MYNLIGLLVISLTLSGCVGRDLTPMEIQAKQAELVKRCLELKKDIENLKGKPIQRNAAIEYYNDECNTRTDPGFYN